MSAPLSVADRAAGTTRPPRQRLAAIGLVLILLLLATGGWLLWDNRRLDVTTYDVVLDELPAAADGLRIAQISDLHAAQFGTFQDRVVTATTAAEPDLIALTGDLIDYRTTQLDGVLAMTERLQAIAPTYFVLGNHEADSPLMDELIRGLEARGITVLRNEAVEAQIAGVELSVVGLDDPRVRAAAGESPQEATAVLAGLGLPEDGTTVLLAHRPEQLDSYTGTGADLVLSGHAHGGQVRIPGVGGLYAPHQGLFPALTEGVHERQGTTMVISRGLGNSIAGVRVNNPRELVIVEMRSGM
ncbi:MAG: metallophosphoesterase [Brachybacterium sp.]|uniref:metallophosphoesterase n=1 Tax=unclassified Brachybacterium TaxID=2623841 RepID=UPI003F8DFF91